MNPKDKKDEQLEQFRRQNTGAGKEMTDENRSYPSLSQLNTPHSAATQRVGVLIASGFDGKEVERTVNTLKEHGAFVDIISETLGPITGEDGTTLEANKNFIVTNPTLYDSIYIVGGQAKNQPKFDHYISDFVHLQYLHLKPIAVAKGAESYIQKPKDCNMDGIVFAGESTDFANEYVQALAKKRFWNRTELKLL